MKRLYGVVEGHVFKLLIFYYICICNKANGIEINNKCTTKNIFVVSTVGASYTDNDLYLNFWNADLIDISDINKKIIIINSCAFGHEMRAK